MAIGAGELIRQAGVAPTGLHEIFLSLAAEVLAVPVDPDASLIEQGLDSLGAVDLIEALEAHGYSIDYEHLLGEVPAAALASFLRAKEDPGPEPSPRGEAGLPFDLTGAQRLWAELDSAGWGNWANISLCLSFPAAMVQPAYLAALVQSLSDTHDVFRAVLVAEGKTGATIRQRILPKRPMHIELREAPAADRDALRVIEAFEGETVSPYERSARALVLASPTEDGRHWLCITMHHVFADRISFQILSRQIRRMVSEQAYVAGGDTATGFADYARWDAERTARAEAAGAGEKLDNLLSRSGISSPLPRPGLSDACSVDPGHVKPVQELSAQDCIRLEAMAQTLETTVPLLLHAVFSVLAARLTGEDAAIDGARDLLLCHVTSNRERHPALRTVLGCLDTSVPVAIGLKREETLGSWTARTKQAFLEAHGLVADLPRGGWLTEGGGAAALIERVPHINVVRSAKAGRPESEALGIREHAVRRVQKARWGLLLRVWLPSTDNSAAAPLRISAYADDDALARAAQSCFHVMLRELLAMPKEDLAGASVTGLVDRTIARHELAAAQVSRAAALVANDPPADAFIYEKLVARQRRWYAHDAQLRLCRDGENRFIGTSENPFPFTQLDKLKERRFLEEHGIPLPRLLHVLPRADLRAALPRIAPTLPDSFVIKPVGAGHSFGVTIVVDGRDITRNGTPFDAEAVARELEVMAERGSCRHEGRDFPFNFSSFLIEDLVRDERGAPTPTDYKVFVIGDQILWVQLHFRHGGHNWVAFVDEDFRLLPKPAWDPVTCWRTHRALVCTDQDLVTERHPVAAADMLSHSKRLGEKLGLFVRLDWYADAKRGALMGEITTFPHMLQPRSFYTAWANDRVRAVWVDPDGCGSRLPVSPPHDPAPQVEPLLDPDGLGKARLADLLPGDPARAWSVGETASFADLRTYVARFDLAHLGISGGDRVALWIENGPRLGAALLAVMSRYAAVPLGQSHSAGNVADQLAEDGVRALLVVEGSVEAGLAGEIANRVPGLVVVELVIDPATGFAGVAPGSPPTSRDDLAPERARDDTVLLLRTSGATGAPKSVGFTLGRLMHAGREIARSLDLTPEDIGISMLPLHHIGGIACNLLAPLLSGAPMRTFRSFDPAKFFSSLSGPDGATWCYMVPTMWRAVLDYAADHPELAEARPWPRLRLVRSAGADLPHPLAVDLAALFGDAVAILPTYGMTEAMPVASPRTSYRLERPGSVGQVLPRVEVEIAEPGGDTVLPPGSVGEITVKGAGVLPPDASVEGFTKRGFFRTGDLGRLAEDGSGTLYVTGRLKECINCGGETVAPSEIEARIADCPDIRDRSDRTDLMAFARDDRLLGEGVALAMASSPPLTDPDRLLEWCARELPRHLVPKSLILMPDLPRSALGKPLRSRLSERLNACLPPTGPGITQVLRMESLAAEPVLIRSIRSAGTTVSKAPDQPTGLTLDTLLDLVRPYAGKGAFITPDTRLDDAGVNSLAAMELSLRLGERLGCDLPQWIVSDNPTPRALHQALHRVLQEPGAAGVPEPVREVAAQRAPTDRGPFRVLFLHGEASDSDLMRQSLEATRWRARLGDRLEFLFMDAPHPSRPKPEFHKAAVDAGLYQKSRYLSWGVTDENTLNESIGAVISALDGDRRIDGIGGICDGGLVAALVAARRSDLRLCLNISSAPLSRLPESATRLDWQIPCTSIHVVSSNDEFHSYGESVEITARCRRALLLQHDRGHAIPVLNDRLFADLSDLLSLVTGPSDAPTIPGPAIGLARNGSARTAKRVQQIMAQVLGHRDFAASDDFFALGGDSLRAMTLVLRLEGAFGVQIPLEDLYLDGASAGTIAGRIDNLLASDAAPVLVPLNTAKGTAGLFALPTLTGHLSDYLRLGEAIAGSASLTGVRLPALMSSRRGKAPTLDSVARMAAETIAEGRPKGTINLVGFSSAGILAAETAAHLADRGLTVNTLALIDAGATLTQRVWPTAFKYLADLQKSTSRRLRGKANWRPPARLAHLRLKAEVAKWRPRTLAAERSVLFVAEEGVLDTETIALWRAAAHGGLSVIPIQGDHGGLRRPDVAQSIAAALDAYLADT